MDNIVSVNHAFQHSYFEEGAMILVDKPLDWTSFDVVNKIRYAIKGCLDTKKYKVGHAGTLDPRATGLLIICIGKYTKMIEQITMIDKGYEAEITLGTTTPSFDGETLPDEYFPKIRITDADLERVEAKFSGTIEQLPPMYSAVKVKGVPLYRLARKGEEVKRKLRKIHVDKLQLKKIRNNQLSAVISCSKGTYIRTLAHDIGKFLLTGSHLTQLRRTRIGNYSVEEAITIEEAVSRINKFNKIKSENRGS